MKKRRMLVSLLLAALLCVGLLPNAAFAADGTDTWDGTTVADAYASGDGSEASPYEIATAAQFAYFAQ